MTPLRLAALMLLCGMFAGCGGNSNSSGGSGGGGNGSPTTVTVKFTGGTPLAVATQIGSGSFTPATATSNAVTLTVPAGTDKFAVAYVCQTVIGSGSSQSTYTFQDVIQASTRDATSFSRNCGSTPVGTTGTLTGNVDASAISGANYVGVSADNGTTSLGAFVSGASTGFNVAMPAGTDRVAVGGYVYHSSNQLGANSTWTLAAIRNFTEVAVPGSVNGGSTVTLGASDAVVPQLITYNNLPSGYTAPNTTGFYVWKSGGAVMLSNALSSQYPAVPASATQSGDFYSFQSSAQVSSPSGVFQQVWAGTNTTTNGPLTVTFPSPWNYAGPTPAAQPTFDISGSGLNGKTGVAVTGEMVWNVGSTGTVETSVNATSGYLNGANSLSFPSLSGLTGFSGPPPSGTLVVWYAGATQSSAGALQPIGQSGTLSGVANSGTFTVP